MTKDITATLESPIKGEVYTFEQAQKASTNYFKGDDLAAKTFVKKYALKDSNDNIYELTPDDMHKRLAKEIARIEQKYENPMSFDEVYNAIKDFKYIIPQGGPMSGIGNDNQIVSLSNCFVVGNNSDSYGGIMKVDQEQVQLMKRRGGVGHDLSHIRPKGMPVKNSALTSTGIVPFMERYSNSTREVAQDGRRGALMLSASIRHPDAERFIDAKMEEGKITGANVSVKIHDDFMKAVESNSMYKQQWPIDSDEPKYAQEIKAKDLWDKIVHNAWKSAEPGILFWDTITKESVPDSYADLGYKTTSTNPCGEIPLCPYDSCRLIAVNLYEHVDNPFTPEAKFNYEKFNKHVNMTQRIMDDIIDLELEKIDGILEKIDSDPEDEDIKHTERKLWENIRTKAEEGRRTGVGITAEGDMLAALGLTYGTPKATDFSEDIHKRFALSAYRSSVDMAKERGAFKIYDSEREKDNPLINRIKLADSQLYEDMVKYGRRNIALLTIAPTGTTSLMAQTTSGIEPVFLPAYKRRTKVNPNDKDTRVDFVDEVGDSWQEHSVFHEKFKVWMKVNGYDTEKEYSQEELDEMVSKSPYYKATSNDVDWLEKVRMQGKIQKWIDHSISVTINLPSDVDEELVGDLYFEAWKSGCKGVTVYRDGSRSGVLLSGKEKYGGLEKVTLVQNKVKHDKRLEMKPHSAKYKVKRSDDSLHVILTSDLYVDDKNKKAYFIPNEDFQVRAPLGAAASVSFAQSGMDRTEILRGPNPNYAEFVSRLQSAFSNELEGMGPRQIKSTEHAVGLVFEDYLLRNGIIGKDPMSNKLVNLINKQDLRLVEQKSEEYKKIISQLRSSEEENNSEELEISGNNGKLDKKFVCDECGSNEYTHESGCNAPKCSNCGHDNGVGCG